MEMGWDWLCMSGSHRALDRLCSTCSASCWGNPAAGTYLADLQKSLWVRDGATQGRIMEQGVSVSLGRRSNVIGKPKLTKVTVGTGYR